MADDDLAADLAAVAAAATRFALSLDMYRHNNFGALKADERDQIGDQVATLNQIASILQSAAFLASFPGDGVLLAKVRAVTSDLDTALDDLDAAVAGVAKVLAFAAAGINVVGTLASGNSVVAILKAVDAARQTLA